MGLVSFEVAGVEGQPGLPEDEANALSVKLYELARTLAETGDYEDEDVTEKLASQISAGAGTARGGSVLIDDSEQARLCLAALDDLATKRELSEGASRLRAALVTRYTDD